MNEVEKLYENAGIEPTCQFKGLITGTCQNVVNFYYNLPCKEEDCKNFSAFAKVFTAEKQIELIKWLIQKNFYNERIIRSNFEQTYFYCTYIDDYGDYCESEYFEKFEEALANVFNYFWQSLTPAEKQQIREVLE